MGSYRLGDNSLGLSDCCGNVWEWCADSWDEKLAEDHRPGRADPRSHASNDLRAIRGGSFDCPAMAGRTSFRHRLGKAVMRADIGFRIVFGDG